MGSPSGRLLTGHASNEPPHGGVLAAPALPSQPPAGALSRWPEGSQEARRGRPVASPHSGASRPPAHPPPGPLGTPSQTPALGKQAQAQWTGALSVNRPPPHETPPTPASLTRWPPQGPIWGHGGLVSTFTLRPFSVCVLSQVPPRTRFVRTELTSPGSGVGVRKGSHQAGPRQRGPGLAPHTTGVLAEQPPLGCSD